MLDLSDIESSLVDDRMKGHVGRHGAPPLSQIGRQG
jgi:hypothetical protein